MTICKTVLFFSGTTLSIGGAALAAEQGSDLNAELARLRQQVAELRTAEGGEWLTEQRAAEIRSIVTDVLGDAESRSSLQGSGAGAGYDNGFFISSADGAYSMKLNVLQQIRWTLNDRSDAGFGEDQTWGFENKRTRLTWSGNVFDGSWSYKIAYYFAYSNDVELRETTQPVANGPFETVGPGGGLADEWIAKDFGGGLVLTVGQFKLPFAAEYGVDAGNLQLNDYSTISNYFSDGYGQGIMLSYTADAFRAALAYVNAFAQVDRRWRAGTPSEELAFTGRAEALLAGTWSQFDSAQSFRGDELGIRIGGGLNWSDDNRDERVVGGDWKFGDVFGLTADVTADFGGSNLMAAFYWDNVDKNGTASQSSGENPWGITVQGGFFASDQLELVARYEFGDADENALPGNDFSAITVGANWYFMRNAAKFGADFGYSFDTIDAPWGGPGLGNNWLVDGVSPAPQDGQWVLQAQLSLSF